MSRFTIRELFLGTVIVALALGWCLDRLRFRSQPVDIVEPAAPQHQLLVTGRDSDTLYLYNPQTGTVWKPNGAGKWTTYVESLADSKKPYPIPSPVLRR